MPSLKSLAKDTAIYGLSSIIGRFLNYLLVPLYTAKLTAASGGYGIITNMYALTALILVLLTFGMETTFFRFANKEGENPQRVFSTALIGVSSAATLFFVAVLLFITPVSRFLGYEQTPQYVWVMALAVSVDAIRALPFTYLRQQKKAVKFAALQLLNIAINIALNLIYYVVMDGHDPGYAFYINLVCSVLVTLCLYRELFQMRHGFDSQLELDIGGSIRSARGSHDVRAHARLVKIAPLRREVFCGGIRDGTAKRELAHHLHGSLPHRLLTHNHGPIVILQACSHHLGRSCRIAIHQNCKRCRGKRAARSRAGCDVVFRLDLHDHAASLEKRDELHCLREVAARAITQVEHEGFRALAGKLRDRTGHE